MHKKKVWYNGYYVIKLTPEPYTIQEENHVMDKSVLLVN